MEDISLVINVDTRKGVFEESSNFTKMQKGVVSEDFFTDGIINKKHFFRGYDTEVIVYVDIHENIPDSLLLKLNQMMADGIIDELLLCKHCETINGNPHNPLWMDYNLINAMVHAKGKYLVHIDQDCNLFRRDDSDIIDKYKGWVDTGEYKVVSYPVPCQHSPFPAPDPNFMGQYFWASTRFFFCQRSFFDYSEMVRCLGNKDYMDKKYGFVTPGCTWTEHVLGRIAGYKKVLYPPHDFANYFIFCWIQYYKGTLGILNQLSYDDAMRIFSIWGYSYPDGISGRRLTCE